MNNKKYGEEILCNLREKVKLEMGEKRYFHTHEVEKMAIRLGEIYAPDKIDMLRAAALLHDITKERSDEEHIEICEKIIYLADYIDMSRQYGDCVLLRDMFFSLDFDKASAEEKMSHLREVLIKSYDLTMAGLIEDGKLIERNTIEARNYLILER